MTSAQESKEFEKINTGVIKESFKGRKDYQKVLKEQKEEVMAWYVREVFAMEGRDYVNFISLPESEQYECLGRYFRVVFLNQIWQTQFDENLALKIASVSDGKKTQIESVSRTAVGSLGFALCMTQDLLDKKEVQDRYSLDEQNFGRLTRMVGQATFVKAVGREMIFESLGPELMEKVLHKKIGFGDLSVLTDSQRATAGILGMFRLFLGNGQIKAHNKLDNDILNTHWNDFTGYVTDKMLGVATDMVEFAVEGVESADERMVVDSEFSISDVVMRRFVNDWLDEICFSVIDKQYSNPMLLSPNTLASKKSQKSDSAGNQ
jgi:hypothetical protein